MNWTKTAARLSGALCLASVLAVASCGQGQTPQPETPAAANTAPAAEPVTWRAAAPTTVEAGPPPVLHLGEGYAYALLEHTPVQPGDAVTANYTIQGEAGRYVRVIIQRHCNPESGDDNYAQDVLLTGEPQQGQIAMTFAQAYSCIRISFISNGFQQFDVTVQDLTVTRSSAS